MSHQPERKEKDCLNCGTIVKGRFCQNCGQENVVTHQNFWSLTKHFVFDIFHFDGKFFGTLKLLLFKPGHVAKEYISGKRVKYLDPIRMYLFTSAIFFLILFSISHMEPDIKDPRKLVSLSQKERLELAAEYKAALSRKPGDTAISRKLDLLLDTTRSATLADIAIDTGFVINNKAYRTIEEYDSLQQLMPASDKDGWLMRVITKKGIELNEKYEGDGDQLLKSLINNFIHQFPYILFISLPFFAGLLKLLYVRHKSFYYSDHAVFTLYHYIFSFIILLVIIGFAELADWLDSGLLGWLAFALIIAWFIYLYKGLRNFYAQRRSKTIIKFFLLMIIGLFLILALFSFFFLFTAYQL